MLIIHSKRIRQEDKHLIIYPEDLNEKLSFYSAFTILYNIGEGEILQQFPSFCCTILSLALELEKINGMKLKILQLFILKMLNMIQEI